MTDEESIGTIGEKKSDARGRSLARRAGLDGDGVDAIAGDVAQRGVDQPLAVEPRDAGESGALDQDGKVRFAAPVIARMSPMGGGIIDDLKAGRSEGGGQQLPHFKREWSGHGFSLGASCPIWKPVRQHRFHGRVESGGRECYWPGCEEAGEFRAPGLRPPGADGPGDYRWFCLDHVRQFNAGYDYFDGMDTEEILRAQSPLHGWETQTRAFRPDAGVDEAPRWTQFSDPLEAIAARARAHVRQRRADMRPENARFRPEERRALEVMGLGGDADRKTLRLRYTRLLRQYHPDHNGGDHGHATRLQAVVEAYQVLKKAAAFA